MDIEAKGEIQPKHEGSLLETIIQIILYNKFYSLLDAVRFCNIAYVVLVSNCRAHVMSVKVVSLLRA